MINYWSRHRLLFTVILATVVAIITVFLFVFPGVEQNAIEYNNQSIYKSTCIDFVVPEPSFEQVETLSGTNGIASVYPYYITKTTVITNNHERTSTILIADQSQDLELTMYNSSRLIKKSSEEYVNPILADWQFCYDTSASIGDTISVTIGNQKTDYRIYAIYETNSFFTGGVLLLPTSKAQIDAIGEQSINNGYSGMFVAVNDYGICRQYLINDYRPLGRLKDRSQFTSDEQYQIHYDAITSSNFSNEITDFRILESGAKVSRNSWLIWLGALLSAVIIVVFNIVLQNRGCENLYFTRQCIPAGMNVKPYYITSFVAELLLCIGLYSILILCKVKTTSVYIPDSAMGFTVMIVPIMIIAAELVSLVINYSKCRPTMQKSKKITCINPAIDAQHGAVNQTNIGPDDVDLSEKESASSDEEKQ